MIFLRRMFLLVPALAHLGALLLGVVHGEVPKSGAGGQRYERGGPGSMLSADTSFFGFVGFCSLCVGKLDGGK